MGFENIKITRAYESVVNEKFKDDIVGVAPHIKTVAILTADNPFALSMSHANNFKRSKKLEAVLKAYRIPYRKIIGHYGNVEHSYELINVSLNDVKIIAAKFNQQSFIFVTRNQLPSTDNRGTRMSYGFYAYRSKFYDADKEKFLEDNKGAADDDKMKYPTFNPDNYIEVDRKDSLDYHSPNAENDDFYTRKNEYKFSIPFDYFDDKHMTDAESELLSKDVKRVGESEFIKRTDESLNDKNTAKWRWENRVMLFGRGEGNKEFEGND